MSTWPPSSPQTSSPQTSPPRSRHQGPGQSGRPGQSGGRSSPRPSIPASVTIPGVRLLNVLGTGGFATVYAGIQESLERPVAVKVDSRPLDDERNRRRFLREVQAASRISAHPHVVSLVDTGVLGDGRPYLVMEMCAGGSLEDLISAGPTPAPDAVALVEAAASALGAAHAAGVTHRDVKPANILLDSYGSPRLSDFGIASIEREGRDPTVTLDCLTPDYAAPEAFMLSRPGPQGDVWSLGAVLFTLLTTYSPRRGPDGAQRSLPEIVHSLEDPLDLSDPRVPETLLPLLTKAMAPRPQDRFADGRELTRALAQAGEVLGAGSLAVRGPVAQLRLAEAGLPPAPAPGSDNQVGSQAGSGFSNQNSSVRPGTRLRAGAVGLVAGLLVGAAAGWGAGSLLQTRSQDQAAHDMAVQEQQEQSAGAPLAQGTERQEGEAQGVQASPSSQGATSAAQEATSAEAEDSSSHDELVAPPFDVGSCVSGIVSVTGQSSASRVDCAQPHYWEVFAVGVLAEDTATTTDDALETDTSVQATCTTEAAGRLVDDPDVAVLGPDAAGQAPSGARGFSCLVSRADGEEVTGSYADQGAG